MLPNLIIIGAQKCGTTSLHYYLSRHPQIAMSRLKELQFFTVEGNWHKGATWYESQFDSRRPIRGEASPSTRVTLNVPACRSACTVSCRPPN